MFVMFGLVHQAHASNCPLASGGSISSALGSCGSGNTVTLAVGGTYSVGSQITIPCGVSLWGPVQTSTLQTGNHTPNQTAHINGSVGNSWGFKTTSGCTAAQSFEYLEWNGGRPNPGGGFLQIVPGTQHFTEEYNNVHGNNCGAYCGSNAATLTWLDSNNVQQIGNINRAPNANEVTNDVHILWNFFAAPGDCGSGAIILSQNSDTEGGGGACAGVGMKGYITNLEVSNNMFLTGDNEMKFWELMTCAAGTPSGGCGSGSTPIGTAGECNNCVFRYNDLQQFDRIGAEMQVNWGTSNEPTLIYFQYTSIHNELNPHQQDFDISMANGCINNFNTTSMTPCEIHMDYNMTVADTNAASCGDVGFEFWAGENSTANGNFFSGQNICHSMIWDPSGHYSISNTTVFTSLSNGSSIGINNAQAQNSPAFTPTATGNVNGGNNSIQSVAPVLTVSGSVITIHNTNVSSPNGSNPGRDSNTTFWCTLDGSTPVAGSNGTPYWVGAASQTVATVTTTGSGTFKCIGQWGAPNQPFSYASGLGYTPSAVTSIAFTGGTGTLNSCTLAASPTTLTVGGPTSQVSATCGYTAGSPLACSPNADANGGKVTTWGVTDSSKISIGSFGGLNPGLVTAVAAGTASATAIATQGSTSVNCTPLAFTVGAATLVSVSYGTTGGGSSIQVGNTIQFFAECQYSNGSQDDCTTTDSFGNVAHWASSVTGVGTITSPGGKLTGISAGITNVTGSVGGSFNSSNIPITVTNNNPNGPMLLQGISVTGLAIP